MRPENLFFSITDIGVCGRCLTECLRVEISVLVKHFCVIDHDLLSFFPLSCFAGHMNLHKPTHILPEIQNQFTLRSHDHLLRLGPAGDLYRFPFLPDQDLLILIQYLYLPGVCP